ncbi:MAG: hypothetical protein FWE22_01710 [Firmicutes bacterium]|nr:hypothetical protein [Bacillota bacterium]
MNFAKEMLIKILENEQIKVKISISKKDYAKMFADGCYVALSQIREIIKDDKLSTISALSG